LERSGRAHEGHLRSALGRYAIAVAAAAAGILLRFALNPLWGTSRPFIFLFPAILTSAWLGGLGPGLATTLICAAASAYLWMEPVGSFAVSDAGDLWALLVFVVVGGLTSVLSARWRAAAEVVRRSEEKFRLAVEAAPAAVILVDRQGTIVLINALAETLFGYRRDELTGQPVERLVPARFGEAHVDERRGFFRDSLRRPMGAGRDLYALRKDGSEVPVEIGLAPFETEAGTMVMAAVTDITERKRNEAVVEDAMRAREEFLSVASHELRNPVNALQLQLSNLLQALPRDAAGGALRERVARANVQIHRLARLINNLLDQSRISAGLMSLTLEEVDFREIVRSVLEQFQDELKPEAVTLSFPPEPLVGRWDRLRLEQVVTNLLSNAINYGGGKPIALALKAQNRSASLSITDQGIGIDPEKQKRLFSRFERAVPGWQYGGFGLGLWITRQIVEAMGGMIAVESRPGRGSTFTVALPLDPPLRRG
jgi:PAS domain S-box-containing protein